MTGTPLRHSPADAGTLAPAQPAVAKRRVRVASSSGGAKTGTPKRASSEHDVPLTHSPDGWWAISFMAGAQGDGGGVASAGILGTVWAAMTNGFPIVYCPPVCAEASPLSDFAHVGSILFGILMLLVAIWSLWRARVRPGWFMPAVAAALAIGTVVALANTPIT